MIIKIDIRESELFSKIKEIQNIIPSFKDLIINTCNLPLGDIIITDENEEEILIIERKTINDLLSSIKDGRYEEQSYRLNGLNCHNHNIIYLIEGDVNKVNRFQQNNKFIAYSAMFSLNYYKGFSVFRTFNIEETAIIICNMTCKLQKNKGSKNAYYTINNIIPSCENNVEKINNNNADNNEDHYNNKSLSNTNYVSVIKKVKKDNITPNNIDEIMLCQIPSISSVTASAIISKFLSINELIKQLENDNNCLKDISYVNDKGQSRKISKTCISNILKFLLKK